tara:strand:- start:9062 stop:9358 length:297 start_codon:yes stop_codon:yes gene_type:complete
MSVLINDAIVALGGSNFSVRNEKVYWNDGNPKGITDKQIQTKYDELVEAEKKLQYQRDRADTYPPIGDQLDALYHAGVFPKEMADKLKAVKDKYPKPD